MTKFRKKKQINHLDNLSANSKKNDLGFSYTLKNESNELVFGKKSNRSDHPI